MPLSRYLVHALLDHVHRGVAYAPPAATYVGLLEVAPTMADDAYVELAAWPRQAMTWSAAANRSIGTADPIAPPELVADVGPVAAIGVWDAPTGGNLLEWVKVTPAMLLAGTPYYWPAGSIVGGL